MLRIKKTVSFLLAAMMLTVLTVTLGACGGKDDSSGTDPSASDAALALTTPETDSTHDETATPAKATKAPTAAPETPSEAPGTPTVTPKPSTATPGATATPAPKKCEHSYSWKTTKAATCEAAGTETGTCTKCGNTETRTISAAGHSWDAGKLSATLKSCADTGTRTYTCTKCGKTKSEQATGSHTFGDWEYEEYDNVVEFRPHPNTVEINHYPGHYKYHVCKQCGYKEYDPTIGKHICNNFDFYEESPTCVSTGRYRAYCDVCGYLMDDHVLEGESPYYSAPYHTHVSSWTEHLCDASYECNALDVTIYRCEDCGQKSYIYDYTFPEYPDKWYIKVGFYDGDSYMSTGRHGNPVEDDYLYLHPTWQNVERDYVFDSDGYVIQFTSIWHDQNGTMYSEVVHCASEEDMYEYFGTAIKDKIDRRRTGIWMLKPRGDHLTGDCFLYGGYVDSNSYAPGR